MIAADGTMLGDDGKVIEIYEYWENAKLVRIEALGEDGKPVVLPADIVDRLMETEERVVLFKRMDPHERAKLLGNYEL